MAGCISISAFNSLIGIPIGIPGIKKYKSKIKNKEKHDKIVLLSKSKLSSTEVLVSKALIDLVISHDKLVLMCNNVQKEYHEMKEEIKNLKT